MWSFLAEMLKAIAKFSGLPGLGFSVLPWLETAALRSGQNVKADIPKCLKKKRGGGKVF